MVSPEDVIRIYHRLLDHGIQIWLTGGWGVDALLGEQTRSHKDLDVIMLLDDVGGVQVILAEDGYKLKEIWSENCWAVDEQGNKIPTAFALQDVDGREFDAHAMRINEMGDGIPAWEADEGFFFKQADLGGSGTVAGFPVKCLTPDMQMICHTGYDLPEEHQHDLDLLHEMFGVARP